jgi:inorganic triphosphatase YgiF
VTTYFDTADYLLDRTGLTLRVRRNGNVHTQTVKSRATDRGISTDRNEWEWRIGQNKPDVGRLAATRALAKAAEAIKDSLQPIFVTDIRRTVRLLRLDDNTVVEVAIDEGSIEAGLAREPVSELELELKSGSILPVYEFAAKLQALAPMWISAESKAVRGWHLRTGQTEGGHLGQMPKLGRSVQAALGFREILGGALGHLVANIAATLHGDPEALRQIRSAVRESRAVLHLFERHLDAASAERFNTRLRRLGEIFGEARDWDVFCLETLSAAKADLPAERLEDLDVAAEVARQFAHAVLEDTLRGHEFTALVLGLAIWSEAGATHLSTLYDNGMSKRLGTLAPSLLDRAEGKTKRRGRHADRLSVTKRHALRKSLKKLCFDVGSLAGLYRHRAMKIYRSHCKVLQKILGLANDAAVTKRLAQSLVSASRPDLARAAGALSRWSKRRGHKALLSFKPALKVFRAAPKFWS